MKNGILLIFLCTLFVLNSCNKKNGEESDKHGGVVTIHHPEFYNSIYPHSVIDVVGGKISNQIFEGLVKFNKEDLTIEPSLAHKWEVSDDNLTYTFHLRKGIKFHDSPCFKDGKGRNLNAKDVLYSFTKLCSYYDDNKGFYASFKDNVRGANYFYILSANEDHNETVEGFKVVDDYTFQITLDHPNSLFIYSLTSPFTYIFPKESYDKFDKNLLVGTGPFKVDTIINQKLVALSRNDNYYLKDKQGKKLPYLDGVNFIFGNSNEQQKISFIQGDLDVISRIRKQDFDEILKQDQENSAHIIEVKSPVLSVNYYGFNVKDSAFNDKRVRQAFNYAIDKELLKKRYTRSYRDDNKTYGITPPNFSEYDNTKVPNYKFNPDKARTLMEEAGFPNGDNFPEIELDINKGSGKNLILANAIAEMLLENLNVKIKVNTISFAEKITKSKMGQSSFYSGGWIADYPHPQNFLSLFYGRDVSDDPNTESFPNTFRYKNSAFDELYDLSLNSKLKDTYKYLLEAEKIAMEDAPAIILWYGEKRQLVHANVHNFPNNAIGYFDFTTTYKVD